MDDMTSSEALPGRTSYLGYVAACPAILSEFAEDVNSMQKYVVYEILRLVS